MYIEADQPPPLVAMDVCSVNEEESSATPVIRFLDKISGDVGDEVTLYGMGFGPVSSSSHVFFGEVIIIEHSSWSDMEIKSIVPREAYGQTEIRVTTEGASSNNLSFSIIPHIDCIDPLAARWTSRVMITGSGLGDISPGTEIQGSVLLGPREQVQYVHRKNDTIEFVVPHGLFGYVGTFPVWVEVEGIASNEVEFTIIWCMRGRYFSEGHTGPGFQEYLIIFNPGADRAVDITYCFSEGDPIEIAHLLPAESWTTIDVNGTVGEGKEVDMVISDPNYIFYERSVYFTYNGICTGDHITNGGDYVSPLWCFAEGYTGPGFDEWISVLNPGEETAELAFRFQTIEEGEVVRSGVSVRPRSRATFKINDLLSNGYQNSLKLESSKPIMAERSMYFTYKGRIGV
ncbi:MAG: IPT/TIG domain-containing protein [Actinomycetota bacterium]|nr:IPT/TIG domain-containing protein [Actinomycetota bacterium]